MATKSRRKTLVHRSADAIRPASAADLSRLRSAMAGKIDTSDIPERRGAFHRLKRNESSKLPVRRSVVREAVKREMAQRRLTPYRVWKEARGYCTTLSQSAVHEFLKGEREIELPYAEAIMAALNLKVVKTQASQRPRHGG